MCLNLMMHTQNGFTPLMYASWDGCDDVAKVLLEAQADVNATTNVSV